jgi:hypothetical protein
MKIACLKAGNNSSKYCAGLLVTEGRKVCTNIAETLNISHDSVYREFNNAEVDAEQIRLELQRAADEALVGKPRYLVIDDYVLDKMYSNEIEGTDICYNSGTKRAGKGLQAVSAILTDGHIKMPINTELFLSKNLGGVQNRSKNKIAEEIICSVSYDRAIWDAHYTTHSMVQICYINQKSYLGKIPRNRIVTIGNATGQLQELLRLSKNQRIKSVQGTLGNTPCWLHILKRQDKKIIYLISNDWIAPKQLAKLYKIRWKVECFHRTGKQMLGMQQCQMRDFKKQELHLLYVMLAYSHAERIRAHFKLKNTETAIRAIRSQNRIHGARNHQLKAALS